MIASQDSKMPTVALVVRTNDDTNTTAGPSSPDSPEFAQTATHMAREFTDATAEITRLLRALHAQTERLDAAFRTEADDEYRRFEINLEFRGHRRVDLDDMLKAMKRTAWNVIVDRLGVKNVMSVAKRKAFEEQLANGELPSVSEETILGVLLSLTDQADQFAREAAIEVFDILRPRGPAGRRYAANNAFRVGRRVILPYKVEKIYGGFRVSYSDQQLTAIDGIFHLLDGKGVMRQNRGPLVNAINESKTGRGETDYFRFKCFNNRNLHLEFKRLDLVKALNLLAAGELVLGEDVD